MPNWVSIRLNLSGPHAEIMRFRDTCIRTTSEEKSGKECLCLCTPYRPHQLAGVIGQLVRRPTPEEAYAA